MACAGCLVGSPVKSRDGEPRKRPEVSLSGFRLGALAFVPSSEPIVVFRFPMSRSLGRVEVDSSGGSLPNRLCNGAAFHSVKSPPIYATTRTAMTARIQRVRMHVAFLRDCWVCFKG